MDFMTDRIAALYRSEERTMNMFYAFGVLAIGIGCLGLFGLISYAAEIRTKEIGIRKTLGASIPRIVLLLSTDFTRAVLAANLVAWPAAFFLMNKWLQNFAYRVDMGIGTFILSGFIALVIAALTVGAHTLRAARANPVESLRYE